MFWVRGPGTPLLSLFSRHSWFYICSSCLNEDRGESRGQISADRQKSIPKYLLPPSNFFVILFASLELPFKVADVPHPGQVWETAGVTLDAGKREEDDEVQNWLDCWGWSWNIQLDIEVSEEKTPNSQYLSSSSTLNFLSSSVLKIGWPHSSACLLRKGVNVPIYGQECKH